jgi:hypothetical protein
MTNHEHRIQDGEAIRPGFVVGWPGGVTQATTPQGRSMRGETRLSPFKNRNRHPFGGSKLRQFAIGGAAAAAFWGTSALAADLPTKAPPAPVPAKSCFASFYDYINSSAQDCPLTWNGITLYGAIDIGAITRRTECRLTARIRKESSR